MSPYKAVPTKKEAAQKRQRIPNAPEREVRRAKLKVIDHDRVFAVALEEPCRRQLPVGNADERLAGERFGHVDQSAVQGQKTRPGDRADDGGIAGFEIAPRRLT
jgi:hypothetical protein